MLGSEYCWNVRFRSHLQSFDSYESIAWAATLEEHLVSATDLHPALDALH